MKIRNYLNTLNTETIWRVLRVFITLPNSYTGRQMSGITGLNHKSCLSAMETLDYEGLLMKRVVGRAHLYSLVDNYFTKDVLIPLIQQEQKLFSHIKGKIVRTFSKYCTAIIIYGSYARYEESGDSDLDLCFIVPEKSPELSERLDDFIQKINKKYTLLLSPHVLTEAEVKEKKNLSVLQDIKNEGEWILGDKVEVVKKLW